MKISDRKFLRYVGTIPKKPKTIDCDLDSCDVSCEDVEECNYKIARTQYKNIKMQYEKKFKTKHKKNMELNI